MLGSEINADPTPRKLIMLDLMKQDSAPALYLGRPCYFSVASSPPCAPRHWTYERYSSEIVESMANVLEKFLAAHPFDKVRLFGLSGGGTLVTLLAHRLPQPIAVVTLAANLDIDGWADLHGVLSNNSTVAKNLRRGGYFQRSTPTSTVGDVVSFKIQ